MTRSRRNPFVGRSGRFRALPSHIVTFLIGVELLAVIAALTAVTSTRPVDPTAALPLALGLLGAAVVHTEASLSIERMRHRLEAVPQAEQAAASVEGMTNIRYWQKEDLALLTQDAMEARARETETAQSPSMVLLVLLASAGIVVYAIFLLNPANRGDWLPYSMVIVAESVLILQALLAMWTILSGAREPRSSCV